MAGFSSIIEGCRNIYCDSPLGKEVLLMNELDHTFAEVAQIIEEARSNAYRKVNEELILMYQKVGQTAYEAKSVSRFLYCGISGFAGHLPRERLP